jgi:hypothetical protein
VRPAAAVGVTGGERPDSIDGGGSGYGSWYGYGDGYGPGPGTGPGTGAGTGTGPGTGPGNGYSTSHRRIHVRKYRKATLLSAQRFVGQAVEVCLDFEVPVGVSEAAAE